MQDPVRKEVPEAVATCRRAGIVVRMVTGDNIHTAQSIAKECGILTEGGVAKEGPDFRSMPRDEQLPLVQKLQVFFHESVRLSMQPMLYERQRGCKEIAQDAECHLQKVD